MKKLLVIYILIVLCTIVGALYFFGKTIFPSEPFFIDSAKYPCPGRDTATTFKCGRFQILRSPDFYNMYDYEYGRNIVLDKIINYDWSIFNDSVYLVTQGDTKEDSYQYYMFDLKSRNLSKYNPRICSETISLKFIKLKKEIQDGNRWHMRLHPAFRQN